MKKRILIYLLILALIVIGFIYIEKPRWSPFYCGQYSGVLDGYGSRANICVNAGCTIKERKIYNKYIRWSRDRKYNNGSSYSQIMPAGIGTKFRCVKK